MRLIKANLLAISLLFTLIFCPMVLAEDSSVRIIYVNNKPDIEQGNGGGLSELATFLKATRDSTPDTLFLHGGDSLGPSMLSSFDRGSHMVEILNALGTSCMAVAKREFSYFEDELTLRTSEAEFPILSTNIYDPLSNGNLEGINSGYLFEIGGHSIGVTAIVSEDVIANYMPKRITLIDADQAVRKTASDLRSQGAELVILLADYEPSYSGDWLQEAVVDLVFVNANGNQDLFKTVNNRMIAAKGRNNDTALDIQISFSEKDGKLSTTFEGIPVVLAEYEPDKQIQQRIDQYLGVLSTLLKKEIGIFGSQVNTQRNFVRTRESQFGNLVADALRHTYNVDVGFFNGGSIRGNRIYAKGEQITRKTVQQELPYRNTAAILNITGAQILQALENGFSRIEDAKGRFPQVSGIKVEISPALPVGQRVQSVMIGDKPLVKEAHYRLATTTFLAGGGDGYDSFKSAQLLQETVGEQIIADIVSEYISDNKVVSPVIEGRILRVGGLIDKK